MLRHTAFSSLVTILISTSACELITDYSVDRSHSIAGAGADSGGATSSGGTASGGRTSANGGTNDTASSGGRSGAAASTQSSGGTSELRSTPSFGGGGTSVGGSGGGSGGTSPAVAGSSTGGNSTGSNSTSRATTIGGTSNASVGGASSGGVSAAGGKATSSAGGVPSGGTPASGGTSNVSVAGASQGGTTAATTTLTCLGTLKVCGSSCVDTQTDKKNCGACGNGCEEYQFCEVGKCLPTYVSTNVLPTTASDSSSRSEPWAAFVSTNKEHGDLIVQIRLVSTSVTLSAPGASKISTASGGYEGAGIARYTADGTLVWGRDTSQMCNGGVGRMAVTSTGEIVVPFLRGDPPIGGPATPTSHYWLGKYNGNTAALIWETIFPSDDVRTVVPRSAKSDFVTFGAVSDEFGAPGGSVCQVADQSTSATVSRIATKNPAADAVIGADGSTLWVWGYFGGGLNPWSTNTWANPRNPYGGRGAFWLIGAQDTGVSIGPWYSETEQTIQFTNVAVDSAGDLFFAATASGYATFGGGQDFLGGAGSVLVKLNHTNGNVMWRTLLAKQPAYVANAPGNRIALLDYVDGTLYGTLGLRIFSNSDGTLLSSISTGRTSSTASSLATLIASGTSDLYVVGNVDIAADFNPGTAVDTKGATPGVFISRYTF